MSSARCSSGVFHDGDPPIHTHPGCDYCLKTSRYMMRPDNSLQLLHCPECNITQYCSRECQQRDWKAGHRRWCKRWQVMRDKAVQLSGNPHAWTDFARWLAIFHDSMANASLAYFMTLGGGSEADDTFVLRVDYVNDDQLPLNRKFRLVACEYMGLDAAYLVYQDSLKDSFSNPRADLMDLKATRLVAASHTRLVNGEFPEHVGSYLLATSFGNETLPILPRLFQFTNKDLQARPIPDLRQMKGMILGQHFSNGWAQKYCCGKSPESSTCCCGGWIHERVEEMELVDDEECDKNVADAFVNQLSTLTRTGVRTDVSEDGAADQHESEGSKPKKAKKKKKKKVKRQEQPSISPDSLTALVRPDAGGDIGSSAADQTGSPLMADANAPPPTYTSKTDFTSVGTSLVEPTTDEVSCIVNERCDSAPATPNRTVDSPVVQDGHHVPKPISGDNSNERVSVSSAPKRSSPTHFGDKLAKERVGVTPTSLRMSEGQIERLGVTQPKTVNKKKPKRRQSGRDSVVSESNGGTGESSPHTLKSTSTTGQGSIDSEVAPIGAVQATGATQAAASGRAATPLVTRENTAGMSTNRPACETSEGDSVSNRGDVDDMLAQVVDGVTAGQWFQVKSHKEKRRVKHKAQSPAELSTSFAASPQGGRSDGRVFGGRGSTRGRTSPTRSAGVVRSPKPAVDPAPEPVSRNAKGATIEPHKTPSDPDPGTRANSSTSVVSTTASPIGKSDPKPTTTSPPALESASPPDLPASSPIHKVAPTVVSAPESIESGPPPSITTRPCAHFEETPGVRSSMHSPSLGPPPGLKHPGLMFGSLPASLPIIPAPSRNAVATTQVQTESAPAGAFAAPVGPVRILKRSPASSGTTTPATAPLPPTYADKKERYEAARHRIFAAEDHEAEVAADMKAPSVEATTARPPAPTIVLEENSGTSERRYPNVRGGAFEMQQPLQSPTWPSLQPFGQSHESEPSEGRQGQTYHGYHWQQQDHGPTYQMYPPPGYIPQQAPRPYYDPYTPQAHIDQYAYAHGAPYDPYVGAYGSMPDPYGQPMYAHQMSTSTSMPAPADQDAARTLKAAAQALKAAARVLEGATRNYEAAEEAYAAQSGTQGNAGVQ
ncbi:hypothetical protein PENSPDRAFT_740341 [Peniophora sp. CONT]|nr:hypothetical protein PENSPDRAFT_740341 [Peniophora sp. CONT]